MITTEQLIHAFYQGRNEEYSGAGNCASIAIIKAAISAFEFNVFEQIENEESKIAKLKNGEEVLFTNSEIKLASQSSSFILGEVKNETETELFPSLLTYANICYTIMCKMVMKLGDYNKRLDKFIIPDNLELAIETINDGTYTLGVYELLGLEGFVSPVIRYKNLKKIVKRQPSCVAWSGTHTVFASNGYFDRYGKMEKFGGRVMKSMPGKIVAGMFYLSEKYQLNQI